MKKTRSRRKIEVTPLSISPSLAVACGTSAWNSDIVCVLCREHLWAVVDLKRCYRNSLNERMKESMQMSKSNLP